MKLALLATTFMWATIIALAQVLMGCSNSGDSPYLIQQCCIDEECEQTDWCGIIKLEKGLTVMDGDYVRLKTNKEIVGNMR